MTWWRGGVIYHVYVRSFADSNGDGVGDLPGVTAHLDHLAWLGVDAIWLSPVMRSPNADWGYDVADYCSIDPELGTLEDFDRLVAEAGKRGIRVLNDLVPNHTSDQHLWFSDPARRNWYVWADPAPDGGPPNNWRSVFRGGPAWTLHDGTGQYYLHNFLRQQPDLNWWNGEVRNAFDDIFRFWFERGVAGFRLDVAHAIIKDRELRDNPPSTELDHAEVRKIGQRQLYNMNRPEGHEVIRRWRSLCESFDPPRILVGETYVLELEQLASFYGSGGDELNLAFNFPFVFSDLEAGPLSEVVSNTHRAIPEGAWPVWMASNHDVGRFATRWCGGDERKIRLALMLLLTVGGTVFLYYGDEIGLTSVEVPREALRDPVGVLHWPEDPGRDHCRTPMQWNADQGAGFTRAGVKPWLPFGDHRLVNVADQADDPGSTLNLTRALIALRKSSPDLLSGGYSEGRVEDGLWTYRRGQRTRIALNLSDDPADIDLEGTVVLGTRPSLADRPGRLRLEPWTGVVVTP